MQLTTSFDAGQQAFNHFLKFRHADFRAKGVEVNQKWKTEKEKQTNDSALSALLIDTFIQGLTNSSDKIHARKFLEEKVQLKLRPDPNQPAYLQQTSAASAVVQILSEAQRGEIEETPQEVERVNKLIQEGKHKFEALQTRPNAKQLSRFNEALNLGLEILKQNPTPPPGVKWDYANHTFVAAQSKVRLTGAPWRDLTMYAVSCFVAKLFEEIDREAVNAYLTMQIFTGVSDKCVLSKEIYIHCTDGWSGQLHFKVKENVKNIFNTLKDKSG